MLSSPIAMMMARTREAEVCLDAERSLVTGRDEGIHGRHRRAVSERLSARRLLISKTGELIRLADSLDCKRDELVRMIESVS
jgi:hypothetical protein